MSSNEFSMRDKFRPYPLEQLDAQVSFSKENTEKSMQGSFYDCDITSLNTLGLSSARSRTRRNESISSKSKISSRNMLEFEEFILENPVEMSKRGYLLDTVINTMDNIDKERERERTFDDSHNKTLPTELLNDDYLLTTEVYPTTRRDESKNDGLAPLFPIVTGLDTPTVQDTEGADHHEKSQMGGQMNNKNLQQSTNDSVSQKLTTDIESRYRHVGQDDVLSDFTNSFDVGMTKQSVQNDEEEEKAKKLEDYVSCQDVQIKTMLKSCNALRMENDYLRKSLNGALAHKNNSNNHDSERFDYKNKENLKDLERVVAMKAANFYKKELEYRTDKFRKELQSRDRIIQGLQKELDVKDYEIASMKKSKQDERLSQSINVPDSTRLPKTSMADHRQCKSTHRDSSMEFQTPSRPQLRENKFNNLEEQNELVKAFTASTRLSDQVSPSDMKYIQHMADISEKLDEIKRKEKQGSKKESKKRQDKSDSSKQYQSEYGVINPYQAYSGSASQLLKYRTNPNMVEKSAKNRDFSPYASASASEHNKISRQGGSTYEEGSLEDGRISSSIAEAIFEKDISRRDIEEFSPFNMSPAKGKPNNERHKKSSTSNAASQNVSRVNEMSMINETLSENYVTESIHNRLAYELSKQLGASSKFKNKELKNFGKAPREDFMGKTYDGIEKVHQTIQNQKRKISSSTPGSRADTVEKGLKDSITHNSRNKDEQYESTKWKDSYYTNLPSKSENASSNILKTSNLNILKPSAINAHDLKPNKTPSNYEKTSNELYTKLNAKGSEKKTRSATTSQDKIVRKSKDKYDHKYMGKTIEGPFGYSHPSNETMLSINSSVDRMFDKNQHFRSHHSLEREQKFMQTQPYHRNEIINEVDDLSPLPMRSESHSKHSKLSTAPLSSYLKLARSGKNLESSSTAISKKTNMSDLENKENRLDSNPRPNTSSTKGSKRTLFSTESNTEMRNNYVSNLDKLTTVSLRAGLDSAKGSGGSAVHKKSANASSQPRHQTPTTKVYLETPSQQGNSKTQSKSVKTKDKTVNGDLDEVNLSAIENSRMNNSRARSSSNKNTTKSGMRNLQGFSNYPVYNNLISGGSGSTIEYGHSSQGSKGAKAVLHHSSLEHRSYDATYQNEREMMKKNKEDLSRFDLESSVGSRDTYTGQFLAKNRRESYKPYNLYSYDSKKY